jgi:hypothetical protein
MPYGDHLKGELLELFREETRDLWDEEDRAFLERVAADVAREKFLAVTSNEPHVHEANLRHLAATLEGEVARKKLRLNAAGRRFFARALAVAIRAVAVPTLKAWIG